MFFKVFMIFTSPDTASGRQAPEGMYYPESIFQNKIRKVYRIAIQGSKWKEFGPMWPSQVKSVAVAHGCRKKEDNK